MAESPLVTAPEVLTRVDAAYPLEAERRGEQGNSVVALTVQLDGTPSDVTTVESAGEALDEAARVAAGQWRFRPASRGGEPVRVRILLPFTFKLPVAEGPPAKAPPDPPKAAAATPSPPEDAAPSPLGADDALEVTVQGERHLRSEDRTASDYTIRRDVLEAAPRQEGADVLRTVPGLSIARAEGMAIGHRYALRGFDADHGQDIEFRVGGIPINLPSHLHGQGYADLGFLIAESVDELQAAEGVYEPRQGDFAVAGTISARLGVERRGWQLKSSYGAFNSSRQLLLWAPPGQPRGTFGAVQYTRSDGFGQNRRGQTASAVVQSIWGKGPWRYRALGMLYGARSDLAGVLRTDDVKAGRVGFYDVYPYATARAQNALSGRLLGGLFAEYRGPDGDNAELGVWLGLEHFRLQENFTGFIQRSQTLANVAGRGDLIDQQNRTRSLGLSGGYRTAPYRPNAWAHGTLELGFAGRADEIDQAQNLLDAAVRSQTWDQRVDAAIFGVDLGLWGDLDWCLTEYLRVRLGVRGDALFYDVNDRLGNFVPLTRPDDAFIVGFRRSAAGLAVGPRASAEVSPLDWLSIRAAYGEGYRSPQARTLEDGENAPFSKVHSSDLGLRFSADERYQLTLSGYYTQLSDDVAFDADEGRLSRIGKTRRLGAVVHGQARPFDWLTGALSVTFVDAELQEPPPATAEEPQPPFQAGQNLPFVPPVVVRLDLGACPTLVKVVGKWALTGRAGVGLSVLSPRPLPYGDFAETVGLLDASAGLGWGAFALDLQAFNLLNSQYAASEFNFASAWEPSGVRPRTPARHIAAGAPLSWLVTLGVSL